jgi:hypothetical protein
MGLGLPSGGGGDFITYLKFNAKAGRWYTKNDDGDEYEVKPGFSAIFDLENIRTGYMKFAAGMAPDFVYDSTAGAMDADQPDDGYKRGFTVHVFSPKALGGVREISSTAGVFNNAMNQLYGEYEAGLADNAGNLPVVQVQDATAVESKHGTNYAPVLKLIKWAARPDDLPNDTPKQAPKAAPKAAAAPAKEAEPEMADEDEFF